VIRFWVSRTELETESPKLNETFLADPPSPKGPPPHPPTYSKNNARVCLYRTLLKFGYYELPAMKYYTGGKAIKLLF
jgi:hypothetical protein